MGTLHDMIADKGKQQTLDEGQHSPRSIKAASEYMSREDNALAFAYSGWAQCVLPHKRLPPGQVWDVATDRVRLIVQPGIKEGPGPSRDLMPLSVPFGSTARMILLYLQTEALRTRSRTVPLGSSWRNWMERVGLSWGGNTGNRMREQADLLSRCNLSFNFSAQGYKGLINQRFVDSAILMERVGPRSQRTLDMEHTTLSEGFYLQLQKHPVPLEDAAIKSLANNSTALDTYIWLAYRLHSLKGRTLVSWAALKAQHGHGFSDVRDFRRRFSGSLATALSVYPDAKVEITPAGVALLPSRPPVQPRVA